MPSVRCGHPARTGTLIGMTNEAHIAVSPSTARRTGRAVTVAGGTAGALLLWVVNDPWGGIDLAVRQNGAVQHIGPIAVGVSSLLAGLAAWGLLALLERNAARPARTFRLIASAVLLLSVAAPLVNGVGLSSRLVLLAVHLTVGAALIIGLPGRRSC